MSFYIERSSLSKATVVKKYEHIFTSKQDFHFNFALSVLKICKRTRVLLYVGCVLLKFKENSKKPEKT